MLDNSSDSDLIDRFTYIILFRRIVWGYVGMILSLFGIIGNIITIIVLRAPTMRSISTNIYLTALSCSNILFLVIFLLKKSVRYVIFYEEYMSDQLPAVFEFFHTRLPLTPVYETVIISVVYLTIAVSMDRLISIKFPLKAKHILTQRTTRIVILSIYLFSIIYCIPFWFEERYDHRTKTCHITKIGKKMYIYTRILIYIPVVHLIPLIILTYINIIIIKNLIARKRWKRTLGVKRNSRNTADNFIIMILITVIILFDLCQSPVLVQSLWLLFSDHLSDHWILFAVIPSIGISLMQLYMSTNFLLYCFSAYQFRETLIQLTPCILTIDGTQWHFQRRRSRSSTKQKAQTFLLSEFKPRTMLGHSSVITTDLTKLNDLNYTSDESVSRNQQLLTSLMTNSDEISVISDDYPLKSYQHLNV